MAIPPFAPPDSEDVLTSAAGVLLGLGEGPTDVLPALEMLVRLNGLVRCVVLAIDVLTFDALLTLDALLALDALPTLDALLLMTLTATLELVTATTLVVLLAALLELLWTGAAGAADVVLTVVEGQWVNELFALAIMAA